MESVTTIEAQSRFSQLLKRVEGGEVVIITRRERPIARLVPEHGANSESAQRAVAALDALRERIAVRTSRQGRLTPTDFKSAVEEGRH